MTGFSANQTSASLLLDYGRKRWAADADADHLALLGDLYIKARSYALINKIAFGFALISGMAVLVWPSVAVITTDFGYKRALFESAVVQTTITAIAALAFAIYGHYKRQQLATENLMRYVLFSGDPLPLLFDRVSRQLSTVDSGFNFAQDFAPLKKSADVAPTE
jgi:hypothetical protein